MGKSDRQPSTAAPPVVIHSNDARGRRAATETLLSTDHDLVALVSAEGHDDAALARLVQLLRNEPDAALVVAANEYGDARRAGANDDGPGGGPVGLTGWLVRRLRTAGTTAGPAPMVVVRVEPVLTVGGLDPTVPGLGLADLIERVRRDGRAALGVPDDLPRADALYHGMAVADQCRSVGLWLNRYRSDRGRPVGPAEYRRALLLAVPMARRAGPADTGSETAPASSDRFLAELDRIADDARRWWAGPPPHEDQGGIGFRADWRFLLPDGPRRSTRVVLADGDRRAGLEFWQWLVEDGWTERIELGASSPPPERSVADGGGDDVVFVGLGVDPARAIKFCGQDSAVVIEVGRSPLEQARHRRLLVAADFGRIDTYLVTPDLHQAKRYVPLESGDGLGWLLASPPPLPESAKAAGATDTDRPGLQRALRRRLRQTAVDAAVGAMTTVGGATGQQLGGALGHGLLVAGRGVVADGDLLQPEPFVLMTSGHDEGSRAVLTPIGSGESERPTVMKVASRPRYNTNIEAEVARITGLQAQLGSDPLLPDIEPPRSIGALLASREVYAGRWTASDLCYRLPDTAEQVLEQVLRTIDRFTAATLVPNTPVSDTYASNTRVSDPYQAATWDAETFDRFVGRLFDRYDHHLGQDRARTRLRRMLSDRAEAITGSPLPMAQRHYDLGPWNVLFGDDRRITVIDWEVGPPRQADEPGPAGADQLYFAKYWLHIAMGTRSVDEELRAFDFLADQRSPGDPRIKAGREVAHSLNALGVPPASTPLIAVHVWLEAALHTIERRRARGIEPGSPGRYVETLARQADQLLGATEAQL